VSRKDLSLEDCFLSSKGVREASLLRSNDVINQYKFDPVCTSPLSRALATCVLVLGHIQIIERENQDNIDLQKSNNTRTTSPATSTTPFLARSDICEFGKGIPENRGRPLDILVKDLKKKLYIISSPSYTKCIDEIDFSMIGSSWPKAETTLCNHGVISFLIWLSNISEVNVDFVCHYNVIKWLLNNAIDRVPNCTPIECILTDDGELFLKSEYNGPNFKTQTSKNNNTKISNNRSNIGKLEKKRRDKKSHKNLM
jgi:hypothetical protein